MIAENLKDGLAKIKSFYAYTWHSKHMSEQWQYLSLHVRYDMEWPANKELIESNFAWKSKKILRSIQGD